MIIITLDMASVLSGSDRGKTKSSCKISFDLNNVVYTKISLWLTGIS